MASSFSRYQRILVAEDSYPLKHFEWTEGTFGLESWCANEHLMPVQICLCLYLIGSVDHRQWRGSEKVVASRTSYSGEVTDLDC
jgi:hypothetical protein